MLDLSAALVAYGGAREHVEIEFVQLAAFFVYCDYGDETFSFATFVLVELDYCDVNFS